jgi:hypothetical protein
LSELTALVKFVRSRFEGGPLKLHYGARSIRAGNAGFTAEATAWIFGSPYATMRYSASSPCTHSYNVELGGCIWCGVYGSNGRIIAHTGKRTEVGTMYWFPYRATLAKLKKHRVPKNYPPLDVAVRYVVRAGEAWWVDLLEAWPALGTEKEARKHTLMALRRFKTLYSEVPPQRKPQEGP